MIETHGEVPANPRLLRSVYVLTSLLENKLGLKLEVLKTPPPEAVIDGLQFDLRIRELGLWGLRASRPLTEKNQAEISATVHGLVNAVEKLEHRRDTLKRLQQRLEGGSGPLPENVIPLRRSSKSKESTFAKQDDKRWLLKLDCLIESTSSEDIHKMAVELHSQSQRYAFLEYHDLERNVRLNFSELLQLGAVTLFIPNILALEFGEQKTLLELMQQNTSQRPLLMVGAHLPYSDLRQEPTIHLEFLLLLSQAYIKLSKPFHEYKDRGLIHYFLDSLSSDPS